MNNKKYILTNITAIFFLYNLFKLYHIRRRSKILSKIYQNHLVIDNMVYNKNFKKNILMVGDSTTVGVGINNEKNHIYNLLSEHYNANIDIIAKSGMRLKQSDIILEGLEEHLNHNEKRYDMELQVYHIPYLDDDEDDLLLGAVDQRRNLGTADETSHL